MLQPTEKNRPFGILLDKLKKKKVNNSVLMKCKVNLTKQQSGSQEYLSRGTDVALLFSHLYLNDGSLMTEIQNNMDFC